MKKVTLGRERMLGRSSSLFKRFEKSIIVDEKDVLVTIRQVRDTAGSYVQIPSNCNLFEHSNRWVEEQQKLKNGRVIGGCMQCKKLDNCVVRAEFFGPTIEYVPMLERQQLVQTKRVT